MRYFDLHCDTVTECWGKDCRLAENSLQVDLRRTQGWEAYVQCYAVWLPDHLHGEAAFARFCAVADRFSQEIERNPEGMAQYPACVAAEAFSGCQGILTVENAAALGGKVENLLEFVRRGVKLCTLTWNGENELGRGVRAPGSGGLTDFGRQAVQALEENGIFIDLSHASPELFWDAVRLARKPVFATHSNARALCSHPRNLTASQFEAVRDSGGLVGLNLYTAFLNDDPARASVDDLLRHADYFLNQGGENTLAFGADWDGAPPEDFPIPGLEGLPELRERFGQEFGKTVAEKIFFENAASFFENHL